MPAQNLNRCITHIVLLNYIMQVIQVLCVGFRINGSNKVLLRMLFFFLNSSLVPVYMCNANATHRHLFYPGCRYKTCWQPAMLVQFFFQQGNSEMYPRRDTQTGLDKISPASWTRHSTTSPKLHPLPYPSTKYKGRFVALKLLTVSTTK